MWMLVSLALAGATLRAGLSLRRARLRGERRSPGARRAHLRLAKPTVALVTVGFAGGPVSAVALRGWEPLATAHGAVACVALALFVATAVLGRRLETGRGRPLDAHALLGVLAVLAGAAALGTGFVLLP